MLFQPAIKWSGSKRTQAIEIVKLMPREIETYYEPFVGGGSVMYQLLLDPSITCQQIICSDTNKDLISLWNEIKFNVDDLLAQYFEMWKELNKDDNIDRKKDFYYEVRDRFNKEHHPADFLFLNRTATNGLIRYNKNNEFNTSFHFSRKGIVPETLESILKEWSFQINKHNVQFINQDYQVITSNEKDYIYLDPPYAATKGIYYGVLNYEELWEWMREQPCPYSLSFDGISGEINRTYEVPTDLYDEHLYINSGVSSFKRMRSRETQYVQESLYVKRGEQ